MQLDGKDEPDAILREYEGQPLQIVADRDALLGKRVQIFTSRERAEDYAHKVDAEAGWAPPDAAGQSVPLDPPPPGQGFLQLYDGFSFATPTWRILEWERSSGNLRNFWAVLWFPSS
jgi:hypothetical protein